MAHVSIRTSIKSLEIVHYHTFEILKWSHIWLISFYVDLFSHKVLPLCCHRIFNNHSSSAHVWWYYLDFAKKLLILYWISVLQAIECILSVLIPTNNVKNVSTSLVIILTSYPMWSFKIPSLSSSLSSFYQEDLYF